MKTIGSLRALPGRIARLVAGHPWLALFAILLLVGAAQAGYYVWRDHAARSHRRNALAALDRWDFEQARSELAYCLALWPTDGPTQFLAGQAARRAGYFDEADKHLRDAENAGYSPDRLALEWTLLRAQRGEVAEVEAVLLGRVAEDDLESPLILEALALGCIHIYQVPKAGRCLDMLLARQPRNLFALVWRGHCLEAIGAQDKAIEDYRKALEIDPDYDEARLRLADRLANRLRHYPEAAEHFAILHQRRPDDARVTVALARCFRLTGAADKALPLVDAVLRSHPDDPQALAERGLLAFDAGKPAEAEGYLRRAVAIPAPDRDVLHSFYRALQQLGKTDEAAAALARGQKMDEDLRQLGDILKQIGTKSQDAALCCRAAQICLRNGQDAEALRWLNGALNRNPTYAPAHRALADYYEQHGSLQLAEEHRQLAAAQHHP